MKRIFRKLHLWLSVPFGLFITLICFSGAMLAFEKEITERCSRDLCFVGEVGAKPLPLDSLMTSVAATLPDSVAISNVTISPDPARAYLVGLSKPRRAALYVDQYTGRTLGRSRRLPFFGTMFRLHRWMLGSSTGGGKLLVGLSTLALVLILVTGLLMWLTNRNKPLLKSLKISCTKGWPRFWHDLHVAGGIYATLFLLLVALTGLTWSFSWYRSGFYSLFGVEASAGGHPGAAVAAPAKTREARPEAPQRDAEEPRHGRRSENGERRSRADFAATPEGAGHRGRHENGFRAGDEGRKEHAAPRSPYARWQQVFEELAAAHPGYRQITLSEGSASVVPAGRTSLRAGDRFDFDRRSGRITGSTPYSEQDRAAKVRSGVYTVHVGSWGGLLTRILTFLAVLVGATLPLTGYYLWIRRLVNGKEHRRPADA